MQEAVDLFSTLLGHHVSSTNLLEKHQNSDNHSTHIDGKATTRPGGFVNGSSAVLLAAAVAGA
jgi:hypothetical protein